MREIFMKMPSQHKISQNVQTLSFKENKLLFWVIAFILIILFFIARRSFLYVFFIAITALIIYYSKFYHIPIDVSPLFFLEIVITRYYSFNHTLLYVLLGYIIPKTFAGSNMKMDSYIFIAISMIANLVSLLFPTMHLMTLGFLMSIIQYVGGILYSTTMRPLVIAAVDGIANVMNNLVWFLIFSDLIIWLLR